MRTETAPIVTKLSDYTPPNFKIESVYLDFDLEPKKTVVKSTLKISRLSTGPLVLDGDDIALKSVKIDGRTLKRSEYKLTQTPVSYTHLTLPTILLV